MTLAPDSRLVDEVVAAHNVEQRRGGVKPRLLILHYTGMSSARAAIEYLAKAESKVSCHYVIDEDGRITQMVAEAALSADIAARNGMPPEAILAHSDVAPARKIDPGEKFDWKWLAEQGVGHWVRPAPLLATDDGLGHGARGEGIAEAQELLNAYGYAIETTGEIDAATEFVLKAFQRHFRPKRVDGRLDRSTRSTIEKLIDALPGRKASGKPLV